MSSDQDEIKKARNNYMRNYRKNNKQKIKDINAKYWLNKSTKEKDTP